MPDRVDREQIDNLDIRRRLLIGFTRRAFMRGLAQFEETSRDGPAAFLRENGAATQEDLAFVFDDRAAITRGFS